MRYLKFESFLIAVLGIAVLAGSASAQKRKPTPKPFATPPVLTGAEIISEAGDIVEPQSRPEPQPARTPGTNSAKIRDLSDRVKKLETYDERQRSLLLNLDILTRAEQRSESLRKQLFEMIEKENTIQIRLDQIEYDIRPEVIERTTVQMAGSLRPEEVRENRRKSLESERRNLQALITQIQSTRTSLEAALTRSDQLVERLRTKLEKDIDKSLTTTDEPDAEQ
jgi:hypothetical protein